MAHLPEAIRARGGIGFDVLPFGDTDALALAAAAYLDPGDGCRSAEGMPLAEAARAVAPDGLHDAHRRLLLTMAGLPRYADIRLCHYAAVSTLAEPMQFAAFCCDIGGVGRVLCFRGTDATVVGWHEDFAMLYESPVNAQSAAVVYLREAARDTGVPLYLTGHSKGGNLAAYAAAHAEPGLQARIAQSWSFDGPGLDEDTARGEGYARVKPRLRRVLPEASFFGLILGWDEDDLVVRSDGAGLGQHNLFTWLTEGTALSYAESTRLSSQLITLAVREALHRVPPENRRALVEGLFRRLEASGVRTTAELRQWLVTELPRQLLSAAGTPRGEDPGETAGEPTKEGSPCKD